MNKEATFEVVVVGGGLAGTCAAIAAARYGCSTALIQDRPVLGGNASSEIRVPVGGAQYGRNRFARETGIIEEFMLAVSALGKDESHPMRDAVLLDMVLAEPNLTVYFNSRAREAVMDGKKIAEIVVDRPSTEDTFRLAGRYFVEASGDGAFAKSAGAEYRHGREARSEFNETRAPELADAKTLGSTLYFTARDVGHPAPYTPPAFAQKFEEADLPHRPCKNPAGGMAYWWIEYGGIFDTIKNAERIRFELQRIVYGLWDHIKNGGDHGAEHYVLDWVGLVPGKRESRRFLGDHILTQSDIENRVLFPDRVCHGGWSIDLHPPEGIYSPERPSDQPPLPGVYSIPYRCLYSRNVENLFLAGRLISVTHVAHASTRLMATCAVGGQAVGTAAALAVRSGLTPREVPVPELQQLLLKDDLYIIDLPNADTADLARTAFVSASSELEPAANVINGVARPVENNYNGWRSEPGFPQWLELAFPQPRQIGELRIRFDTNLNTRLHLPVGPIAECVKDYRILASIDGQWREVAARSGNVQRDCRHQLEVTAAGLRVEVLSTWAAEDARIFEVRAY